MDAATLVICRCDDDHDYGDMINWFLWFFSYITNTDESSGYDDYDSWESGGSGVENDATDHLELDTNSDERDHQPKPISGGTMANGNYTSYKKCYYLHLTTFIL